MNLGLFSREEGLASSILYVSLDFLDGLKLFEACMIYLQGS